MQKTLYTLVAIIACVLLYSVHLLNQVPVDSGDGLSHYFITQNVFFEPINLLDHWGKPLFTLFAAPFAYFGYNAYICFNIIVFALTLFMSYRISQLLNVRSFVVLLFPVVLMASLDYTSNVLGGMTEVFFGFLVIISAWFMLKKQWFWFALLVSFTPFARSEGQLIIPIAAFVLIYYRQWKIIPVLFLGFVIYGVIGFLVFQDFWWYFTQNPYQGASEIYGQGEWNHYINNWYLHLGLSGLIVLVLGVLAFTYSLLKRKISAEKTLVILYFSVIYLGIICVHAYLWTQGKSGALGLSRLAIHGLPGVILASIIAIDSLPWIRLKNIGTLILFTSSLFFLFNFPVVHEQPFPKKAQPDEQAILDAGSFCSAHLAEHKKTMVYYYHPLLAYAVGANLKNLSGRYIQKNFMFFEAEYKKMKDGDLIVWDSHFGNRDMNFPGDKFYLFDEIMRYTPFNQYVHSGQETAHVKILQVNKSNKNEVNIQRENVFQGPVSINKDSLYTNIALLHNNSEEIQVFEINVSNVDLTLPMVFLVIQHEDSGQALTYELGEKNLWNFSLPKHLLGAFKVFVHNPNETQTGVEINIYNIRASNKTTQTLETLEIQ